MLKWVNEAVLSGKNCGIDFSKINSIFESVQKDGRARLLEPECYSILSVLGVALPRWRYSSTDVPFEVIANLLEDGKKYVLKGVGANLIHKTDQGAIAFDVDRDNCASIVALLSRKLEKETDLRGWLLTEYCPHRKDLGHELIAGVSCDPFFGNLLTFGFGGTATEYLKSVMKDGMSIKTIPATLDLDGKRVKNELAGLPAAKLLAGTVRGVGQTLAFDELMTTLKKIQNFALFYSRENAWAPFILDEFEINPLVVSDGKLVALDALIKFSPAENKKVVPRHVEKISALLKPESVCIAGASGKNPHNPANIILNKFIESGLSKDQIYLIHPKEDNIAGVRCYKDLKDVIAARKGVSLDLLIVGVPAATAVEIIEASMKSGASRSIQIISAGFGETKEGRVLQKGLEETLLALDADLRPVVNGPNTLGNIYHGLNTLFTPAYKSSFNGKGKKNVALVSQSGAFMVTRLSDLAGSAAPVVSVSAGNQMDLSVVDFFEYLIDDKDIQVFAIYIEGLKDGDGLRLMGLTERAREMGKHVLVYKAGATKEGQDAAKGHTASMTGDYATFEYMMQLCGAMVAHTSRELDNMILFAGYVKNLETLGARKGKSVRVASMSNAGFEKCAIADHLMNGAGGKIGLASYTPATTKKINEIFKEHGLASIMDVHDILDLTPMMNDEGYEKLIRATLEDDNVDFGLYSCVPETIQMNTCAAGEGHGEDFHKEGGLLSRMRNVLAWSRKPFVFSLESGVKYDSLAQAFLDAGIPCFRRVDEAANIVRKFVVGHI